MDISGDEVRVYGNYGVNRCIKTVRRCSLNALTPTDFLTSPLHLMSSLAPDIGDAVCPDGTLKDASEMTWNYDADDSIPFPSGDQFCVQNLPIAPLCWTTRKIRPPRHFLDGAESDSSTPDSMPLAGKRKTSRKSPACWVLQKVINVDREDNEVSNMSGDDGSATTEPITEPASDGYKAVQAMVDTDIISKISKKLSRLKCAYSCLVAIISPSDPW